MSEQIPEAMAKRLRLARNAAKPVEKKGRAAEGYDFVRAVDIAEETQRLLKSRGIVVIPSVESVERNVGKTGVLVHAHLTFQIVLADTGESVTKSWMGSGFDFYPGDKGLYKAITGGTKYFYANLLGIPFGVDPEEDQAPADLKSAEAERISADQDRDAERPDLAAVPSA